MKSLVWLVLALAATLALEGGECVVVETRWGNLEILPLTQTGEELRPASITLRRRDGEIVSRLLGTNRFSKVYYGDYRVEVYAQGFGMKTVDVRISGAETVKRVELPVGQIGCPEEARELRGAVRGLDATENIWIKAVPLRGGGEVETRLTKRSEYLLTGLEYSDYLVLVMRGDEILTHKIVKTYGDGKVSRVADFDLHAR
jgi:hypothetical protein